MKIALGSIVAMAMAASGAASAADLRPAPVYKAPPPVQAFSWNGCFIGGNAGGIFNNSNVTAQPTISGAPFTDNFSSFDFSGSSGTACVSYGCNIQVSPNFVIGMDSDWNWSGTSESVTASRPAAGGRLGYTQTITQDLDWFSTSKLRLGWTNDHWMVFASGGLATGKVKSSYFDTGNGLSFDGSDSKWRWGWTVGGGVEYALTRDWFLRGEYLYVDLGSRDYQSLGTPGGNGTWLTDVDTKAHVVRAALTYRITTQSTWFGWALSGFKY